LSPRATAKPDDEESIAGTLVTAGVFASHGVRCLRTERTAAGHPEINTDRPDVTEASTVIPKGSLQLEERDDVDQTITASSSLDLSESLLRIGLADRRNCGWWFRISWRAWRDRAWPQGLAIWRWDEATTWPAGGDIDLSVIVR